MFYRYQTQGRIVASEYWAKIHAVADAVRLNRSDAALIRVIVPFSSKDAATEQAAKAAGLDFVNRLLPVLDKHLGG